MITFIGIGFVALIILWVLFINVMWLKYNKEKIPKILHKPLYAIAFVGLIYDILFNLIFGTVLFWELPVFKDKRGKFHIPPLTSRMRRILISGQGWRWGLAYFLCRYVVEPWDPNHCGLQNIKSRM